MASNADELREKVGKLFAESLADDKEAAELYEKIKAGGPGAGYAEADKFAEIAGEKLAAAYKTVMKELPADTNIQSEFAGTIMREPLTDAYNIAADAARMAQQALNKQAGIGLQAQAAGYYGNRLDELIEKYASYETAKEAEWILGAPVKNFVQSAPDNTLRKNAEFQSRAGLRPRIIRKPAGACCEWCSAMAGVYDYPDKVPRDVYRRHANCNCIVEYDPGAGKRVQNVWSKRWTRAEESGKIERREEVGKINSVADAKNYASLKKYLKDTYDIEIDESVKKLNFDAVKQSLAGFESMAREFPEIGEQVKKLAATNSGVMSCGGDEILFNPFYFSDNKKLAEICQQQSKIGFWPGNSSLQSVGVHESAHALEWVLDSLNPSNEYDFQKVMAYRDCLEAKEIVSQACKNIKRTEYGKGKKNEELIKGISGYAWKGDQSEALAEAFADCYANGDNANPLSKEIKKLTIEKYKAYKETSV